MEYEINENDCLRKDELPRLRNQALMNYSTGRINYLVVGDDLKKPKQTFPKNHKKTLSDFARERGFLNLKDKISKIKKSELIEEYNEDSEIRSLVTLRFICENCNQNYQCSNYQNYLISNNLDGKT